MTPAAPPSSHDVLAFWRAAGPDRWFRKDAAFDAGFKAGFLVSHEAAAAGALADWAGSPAGTLALLLLLDQFPRNAFRGTPRMFATDDHARDLADAAVGRGDDQWVDVSLRVFVYLPFMHAERLADQRRCVALCSALDERTLAFAHKHLDVIERFGRFPHRNAVLGRQTTANEQRFLDEGGFAG